MNNKMLNEREIDFLLYELFDTDALFERERYQDHDRTTFKEVIQTARNVAEKHFLPLRHTLDNQQPTFDGEKVHIIPELKPALDALNESGMPSATADYEFNGMQLPPIVANIAGVYLTIAGGTALGYSMLTTANANLLQAHGSDALIEKWVKPLREGRFAGTMAMTEPDAGSGLADLTTSAVKADDGTYRITGNKIYISGGDHNLSDNIVHLVLARVKGAPKGVKGISLFVVPKYLVNDDGSLGAKNDVALAGLFHKMGGRAQTSTALSFGEQGGAIGYLVGEENHGLAYMFHMMNEARIMVGTSGAALAMGGYQYSLEYAKNRPQGRLPSCKDPLSPPVNIIEHADVKRMLLAQKAYAEGALALVLLGSQLSDDEKTANTKEQRSYAHTLLDLLTPVIKTWPSEYGTKANDFAIQVLGGAGYVNEHPIEMFYRDNRLNPIHEGTTGIQSLDLLARKVPMGGMQGYQALMTEMTNTVKDASNLDTLSEFCQRLTKAMTTLNQTTDKLLTAMGNSRNEHHESIDQVLANSVHYLSMFGHVVVAWLWLKQAKVATLALPNTAHESEQQFYQGKLQAAQYFYRYELVQIEQWASLLNALDDTCYQMQTSWF
ncbi:acyl-CoA dehydrogenase [Thalassotalea euphylliae]|uniref:Acyl-CoA dehydrogenase n=1 Tax=Thalassotalea euphylliae TaxID=1655234 RepID=A0A3E0TSP0_9GAMM|nr:acyl-CoA dehydrogenase [Thalassotalea euphylliae]REL26945.1 acyl-CoA dehydrogenase [Thalassotalea euphylliae]